jgi:hypothetical protein
MKSIALTRVSRFAVDLLSENALICWGDGTNTLGKPGFITRGGEIAALAIIVLAAKASAKNKSFITILVMTNQLAHLI